jgi:hypothetical protein
MTVYVEDSSGGCVCEDCGYGACITTGWVCIARHCQCGCRSLTRDDDLEPEHQVADDAQRAVELDDRPRAALESVARDLEAEARPGVEELRRERFGPRGYPTRGRA